MNRFARTAVILCAASAAALAANIDGKWTSERQVGDRDGKTYAHTTTFSLKSDGDTLTGTVVQTSGAPWMSETNGRSIEISDGKVEGNKFSFRIKLDTKQGEKTVVYEGTVEGDRMKGVTKFRGIGQTWEFEAKRQN